MPEEYRVPVPPPPPPPPARAMNPIPPPPPGRSSGPPPPPVAGGAPPILNRPPAAPAIPRPAAGMPPGSAQPALSALEVRLQDMERRFHDQEDSKKIIDDHVRDLERQLKDEHEKVLLQSLKAKEEESLSVKVDEQLREMQDRMRREKYEHELHESRGKAEIQIKDLERRIADERETWMTALKSQLKEREAVERDVEQNLTRRLHDFEKHYQEEKNNWVMAIRQKEEDLNQLRHHQELEIEKLKGMLEDKEELLNTQKDAATHDRHSLEQQYQAEYRTLQAQMEIQMRETGTWKAQLALQQAQLQQVETQHQQDRTRAQAELERAQQDHLELRKRVESQAFSREEDLKREFARRDLERAQYWEGIIAQLRSEKEALRGMLTRHEEELARAHIDLTDLKRQMDVERSHWATQVETARRIGSEEAQRNLPATFQAQLAAERKQSEEREQKSVQDLRQQLAKALEGRKAVEAKLGIEDKRWAQTLEIERNRWTQDTRAEKDRIEKEKSHWEKQAQELLVRIAEIQTREAHVRQELQTLTEAVAHHHQDKEHLEAAIAAALQESYAKEQDLQRATAQAEEQKKALEDLKTHAAQLQKEMTLLKSHVSQSTQRETAWIAREEQYKAAQAKLLEGFKHMESDLAQANVLRTRLETEWSQKEAALNEQIRLASLPGSNSGSPDAQKALLGIRDAMREMQTVVAGMRPAIH